MKQHRDAAASAFLIVLILVLYRKVTRLWWTYDDVATLRTVFDYRPFDFFFNRAVWPQKLFTPLLPAMFKAELSIFGLNVAAWYVFQLAIGCIAALAVYAAARCFLAVLPALGAAVLFLLGVPFPAVVAQLSTVHYLLAVAFAGSATIAYVVALRRNRAWIDAISVALYIAAILAKEVAIPLPFLLVALPVRDLRSRVRYAAGHAVAIIVYFIWRRAVLGAFLGAYGWSVEPSRWPRLLMTLPWRAVQSLAGTSSQVAPILILALLPVIALGVLAAIRSRASLALLIVAIVVTVGPILPVASELNQRYLLVPWLAACLAFAAGVTMLRSSRHSALAIGYAVLLTLGVNIAAWPHELRLRKQMSDEARFFFSMPPDGLLRQPAAPPDVITEVTWLKSAHFHRSAGGAFYDDLFLCTHDLSRNRIWQFDSTKGAVIEITPRIARIARRYCGSVRSAARLSARFEFHDQALHWQFGPYSDGKYSAVLGDGRESFPLPLHGALNMPGALGINLRVRYDSPAGWTTYSPELALDFVKRPDFTWQR